MMGGVKLDPRRIEVVDPMIAEALRRMTPAQRLARAHDMWRYARDRVLAIVTSAHPDWTKEQVAAELRRRMLGSG
jgi:hypothetical protein